MNLDASLVNGQSNRSSSLKQPAEKPRDGCCSEDVSSVPEKQELDTVQNMQINQLEATIVEPGSKTTENLSIYDDLGSISKCGSPRPYNIEYDPASVCIESLKQREYNGDENKQGESEAQESNLVMNEVTSFSEDVTENPTWGDVNQLASSHEILGLQREGMADESNLDQLDLQPVCEFENPTIEQLEPTVKDTIENASFTGEPGEKESSLPLDKSKDFGLDATENTSITVGVADKEPPLSLDQREDLALPPENQGISSIGNLSPSHQNGTDNANRELFEPTEKAAIENTNQSGPGNKETPSQSRKKKSTSTPPVTSARVLRSRSKEKPETAETNHVVEKVTDDSKKKRKIKRRRMGETPVNEFSRIKNRLKYLLNRINCEQHFIDAYSGEGWKGQSLEKIKPENELRRAKSHILHYKLKIRDLFQRLDLLLAEGKIPESLFDSEGEIDSEDIFCAKCASKDLGDNNDIILCDGACERGFHQFCLEPPLLKEDIPPDDEGWLCPGCDCKDDCFDLINDSYGTKLSIVDSWEKVFPEAATAASGKTLDDGSACTSDDSEDDDYNPDKPELDETKQKDESGSDGSGSDESGSDESGSDESGSDDSGFFSASEGLAASPKTGQDLGLPSDESEDDEYDPDGPDHDEQVKQASSSSDFTSDSEDLGEFDENATLGEDQGQTSRDGEKLEVGKGKGQSLRAELSYLLDSNVAPVSEKRHVERFDYKKLHDETYGNVSSDSSDEDFEETGGRQRRTRRSAKRSRSPVAENGEDIKPENSNQNEIEHTPKRARKKHNVKDGNDSSTSRRSKTSSEAETGNKSSGKPYKRLGEVVTQKLYESFKENQYPQRPEKEHLAKELQLTIQQISKWFENARWSHRHSATMGSNLPAGPSNKSSPDIEKKTNSKDMSSNVVDKAPEAKCQTADITEASKEAGGQISGTPDIEKKTESKDMSSNVVDKAASPEAKCQTADITGASKEAGGQISGTPKSRKRKGKVDDQALDQNPSSKKTTAEKSQADTPKPQQVRRSSRIQSGK